MLCALPFLQLQSLLLLQVSLCTTSMNCVEKVLESAVGNWQQLGQPHVLFVLSLYVLIMLLLLLLISFLYY